MDGFVIIKPCELEMSYENYLGLIILSCAHVFICVFFLILSIIYFIFGSKHDPYGKYKHESCFIKIGLYSTYAKRKITLY
jgi:hypothetical protein